MIRLFSFALVAVSAVVLTAGCDPKRPLGTPKKVIVQPHNHPSEGPHGGALVEWGDEEFHVEFTVDHKKQEARIYILGPDAKTATPIKAAKVQLAIKDPLIQIDLVADPQKTDPEGTSSVFAGKHEKLGVEKDYAGTVSGEVNGKAYSGDFKEEEHDHKHDKK